MLLHKLLVQCHISFNYLKVRRSFLTCFKVAHPEQRLQQDEKMLILRYITQEHVKLGAPVISCRLSRFDCRLSRPRRWSRWIRDGADDSIVVDSMVTFFNSNSKIASCEKEIIFSRQTRFRSRLNRHFPPAATHETHA